MKNVSQPAVFLDRDGTINLDHGYVHAIDNFNFYPDVIEALIEIKKLGYLVVIVTNQSGIARGYFSEDEFLQLTEWMDWSLADRGVNLDGIYYCPHHPDGKIEEFAIECECRKPKPGMFLEAKLALNIDMSKSIMVGDKWTDMLAAHSAGVAECYLVNADEETIKRYHSDVNKTAICRSILSKFSDLLHFLNK